MKPGKPAPRRILVIGIGAGNPDYLTVQAIEALNRADVLFIPGKGEGKEALARIRHEICARFIRHDRYRTVAFDMPRRAGDVPYREGVARWHGEIAALYETLIGNELAEDQCGAFLVWGDPSLYDSTIRILDRIVADGRIAVDFEVIPGITAVQALAARHRVTLNNIGQPILIASGRPFADGVPDDPDSIVLMLDGTKALRAADGDLDIFWGAYLGTPDEVLISGKLKDVIDEIERVRANGKREKGWIFETSLLKRRDDR